MPWWYRVSDHEKWRRRGENERYVSNDIRIINKKTQYSENEIAFAWTEKKDGKRDENYAIAFILHIHKQQTTVNNVSEYTHIASEHWAHEVHVTVSNMIIYLNSIMLMFTPMQRMIFFVNLLDIFPKLEINAFDWKVNQKRTNSAFCVTPALTGHVNSTHLKFDHQSLPLVWAASEFSNGLQKI